MPGEKNGRILPQEQCSAFVTPKVTHSQVEKKIQRKEEILMQHTDGFKPFFVNKRMANAVLTVFKCVDGGLNAEQVIEYYEIQYDCNPEEIRRYWNIMQNRWITDAVQVSN